MVLIFLIKCSVMAKKGKKIKKRKYPLIHIEGCQIKSAEKFRKVCGALKILEEEIGIKEVEFYFKDMFICPWIDLTEFTNSKDDMEKLVGGLCVRLDILRYGKQSRYAKIKIPG